MADFAGSLQLAYFRNAFGNAPGILEITYSLDGTTYVPNGIVNLLPLKLPLDGRLPPFGGLSFWAEGKPGQTSFTPYFCVFFPNTPLLLADTGILRLYNGSGVEVSGPITAVIRGRTSILGLGGQNNVGTGI